MRYCLIALCSIFALGGCVSGNQNVRQDYGQYYDARGTIERIETVQGGGQSSGLGAVGGAVVGGLLGNQVGKGTGKTVATVAGVAAGAYAGNEAEKAYGGRDSYRITVRSQDGRTMTFTQNDIQGMRVGDRVRVSQNKLYPDY